MLRFRGKPIPQPIPLAHRRHPQRCPPGRSRGRRRYCHRARRRAFSRVTSLGETGPERTRGEFPPSPIRAAGARELLRASPAGAGPMPRGSPRLLVRHLVSPPSQPHHPPLTSRARHPATVPPAPPCPVEASTRRSACAALRRERPAPGRLHRRRRRTSAAGREATLSGAPASGVTTRWTPASGTTWTPGRGRGRRWTKTWSPASAPSSCATLVRHLRQAARRPLAVRTAPGGRTRLIQPACDDAERYAPVFRRGISVSRRDVPVPK
jgi:hypothetical protein